LYGLIHKTNKKILTIAVGFVLMYAGFILLLLPMIIQAEPLSLVDGPQVFGFEDDLNSISTIYGSPMVVTSPFASGNKAIECQNEDYVRWDLSAPSKTLDLSFKIYWTVLPTLANESFAFGEISGSDAYTWQSLFHTSLYSDSGGYKGWVLWTEIPTGQGSFVPGNIVYALETNHWYTIRMTADLNTGTYELYMDGTRLASITDINIPADVYVKFFRLGISAQGDSNFITYYDDVTASLLGPTPPPNQWSLKITSSLGGSTNPTGLINLYDDENLIINATQTTDHVFSMWTFNGAEYSQNSIITIPAQPAGTRHTLHATFTNTNPPQNPQQNWLPIQIIGFSTALIGAYLLWSQNKTR
jgi:hypothetical protein